MLIFQEPRFESSPTPRLCHSALTVLYLRSVWPWDMWSSAHWTSCPESASAVKEDIRPAGHTGPMWKPLQSITLKRGAQSCSLECLRTQIDRQSLRLLNTGLGSFRNSESIICDILSMSQDLHWKWKVMEKVSVRGCDGWSVILFWTGLCQILILLHILIVVSVLIVN